MWWVGYSLTFLSAVVLFICVVLLSRRCDRLYKRNKVLEERMDELVQEVVDEDLEDLTLMLYKELKELQERKKARRDCKEPFPDFLSGMQ